MFIYIVCVCNVFPGAIFDRNVRLNGEILNHSVEIANSQILMDSDIQLKAQVETIEYGNEFAAADTVCDLLKVCNVLRILQNSFHFLFFFFAASYIELHRKISLHSIQ